MDAKEWSTRRIMIERGTITWTADSICKDVGVVDQVREFFGHEKVFSLEFLTQPPAGDTVELFNGTDCINFQNPYRQFTFCAEPGYTMQKAKEVMDEHLGILGGERQLLQLTAKVERLIVASGVGQGDERAEEEVKELAQGMDDSGDSSVEGLAVQIGNISDSEAPEVQKAKEILKQVQKARLFLLWVMFMVELRFCKKHMQRPTATRSSLTSCMARLRSLMHPSKSPALQVPGQLAAFRPRSSSLSLPFAVSEYFVSALVSHSPLTISLRWTLWNPRCGYLAT